MNIINLTQHLATSDQAKMGVTDVDELDRDMLCSLLTFEEVPSRIHMISTAHDIVYLFFSNSRELPEPSRKALIGGAPFFMAILEEALVNHGVEPMYAFSQRESVEVMQADGRVTKHNVFKHKGFVRPYTEQAAHAEYRDYALCDHCGQFFCQCHWR